MIILACGLSRSGKTSTIRSAHLSRLGIKYLLASDILKNIGRPIENLTADEALANQVALVTAVGKFSSFSRWLLIDGHLLIETTDGPQLVPEKYLDPLPLAGILSFEAEAKDVHVRRTGAGLAVPLEEIEDRIALESIQARRLARYRRVVIEHIRAGDVPALDRSLARICGDLAMGAGER